MYFFILYSSCIVKVYFGKEREREGGGALFTYVNIKWTIFACQIGPFYRDIEKKENTGKNKKASHFKRK